MERFIPYFQGDSNQLTPQGQQLMDLAGKYGSLTNVIPTPLSERKPGLAGHMRFDDVQNVRVDPTQGGLHTAAHEIFHSAFPTAVGDAYRKKAMIGIENPMAGHMMHMKEMQKTMNATEPQRLRYLYETQSVPIMLEEASAQGGAKAFTEQLGYPNADTGFPVPGGFIQQRTEDGQIDSLAYPLIYRDKGINNFMMSRKVGMNAEFDNEGNVIRDGEGMFEGKALGIGIDPRFSPETREEYYRIIDNARPRAQRMFNQVYNKYRY